MTVRPVMKVTRGQPTSDGAGVKMTRVLRTRATTSAASPSTRTAASTP